MGIDVSYINSDVVCRFVRYGSGLRMWMTDDGWFQSVGWCPHLDVGGGECRDCALVLEDSDD